MKYYLMNNGSQQSGPFELNELLGNGLTPQSYVWNETMSNWLPAMQVPEVAAMLNTHMGIKTKWAKGCVGEVVVMGWYWKVLASLRASAAGKRNVQKLEFALIPVEFLNATI